MIIIWYGQWDIRGEILGDQMFRKTFMKEAGQDPLRAGFGEGWRRNGFCRQHSTNKSKVLSRYSLTTLMLKQIFLPILQLCFSLPVNIFPTEYLALAQACYDQDTYFKRLLLLHKDYH